jgi:hypothetical protein
MVSNTFTWFGEREKLHFFLTTNILLINHVSIHTRRTHIGKRKATKQKWEKKNQILLFIKSNNK